MSTTPTEQLAWMDLAACRSQHRDAFYPPPLGETKYARLIRERTAKTVCAGCPVREQCLRHAITNDERYGIWGGLTDGERRRRYDRSA